MPRAADFACTSYSTPRVVILCLGRTRYFAGSSSDLPVPHHRRSSAAQVLYQPVDRCVPKFGEARPAVSLPLREIQFLMLLFEDDRIPGHPEFDVCLRPDAETHPDLLRNGHLTALPYFHVFQYGLVHVQART